MRSFCSTLNMAVQSPTWSNSIRTPGRTGSVEVSKTKRPAQGRPHFKPLREQALLARSPAHIHTAAPRCLSQAHQTACGCLCLRAAGRRARTILEVGDPRYQRLLAKKTGTRTRATIQLQVGK